MARSRYIVILIKSLKGPETSFHSPVLSQKYIRNVCHTTYQQLGFKRFQYLGFKRNKDKCNFHYVAMSMMTSQILKSVHFTKIQKSRYFENETLFFKLKKIIDYTSRATLWQKLVLQWK